MPRTSIYLASPLGFASSTASFMHHLAASLRENGFDPRIVDGAVVPDFLAAIENEVRDALAFGVSLLTGPMIREAIAASRLVRRLRPDLPIVFGGWHPSLMPAQTLQETYVDAVVMHQGERTLLLNTIAGKLRSKAVTSGIEEHLKGLEELELRSTGSWAIVASAQNEWVTTAIQYLEGRASELPAADRPDPYWADDVVAGIIASVRALIGIDELQARTESGFRGPRKEPNNSEE